MNHIFTIKIRIVFIFQLSLLRADYLHNPSPAIHPDPGNVGYYYLGTLRLELCLLTSFVKIVEHLQNRGEEERDVTLLVWPGSLSDLICLDRLQKISSWGQKIWRSESVCVTGLDIG